MRLTANIAGLDSLTMKARYIREAAQTGLKLAASEAAFSVVVEAQTLVPVETGNLRDHIHMEPLDDTPQRQTYQVMPFYAAGGQMSLGAGAGGRKSAADYGFDPAYARRIEYGFFGKDSLGRDYHQAAQPYMRPAGDAKQAEVFETISTEIQEAVFEAMGRQ